VYTAIWIYPWDLLDEGIDTVLDRVADAGIQGISVAAAYHHVRALCPHNPQRAVYHGEGGVIYFRPDFGAFSDTRIRPVLSELAQSLDPLDHICESAARRGIKVHAWTVITHNSRLGKQHEKCTLKNAFGDRYPFGLCPADPDVREYAKALVRSLASRPNLSCIELEALGYMGLEHSGHHSKAGVELDPVHRYLLSLCFCHHCEAVMERNGVAVEKAKESVKQEMRGFFAGRYKRDDQDPVEELHDILGESNADGILAARDEVVLTLLEELYWLVDDPQSLTVMVTGSPLETGAAAAVTVSQAREYSDRLLVQAFDQDTRAVYNSVSSIAVLRGSTPVHAGIAAYAPYVRSGDDLLEKAQAARDSGADGLQFYHYGLMPLENLEWIRAALSNL
jgi:hypothetical protein